MADNNGFAGDDDGISMQGRGRRRVWMVMVAMAAAVLSLTGCDDAATDAPDGTSTSTVSISTAPSAPRIVNPDTNLARRHLCLACHQVDRQLVGPSFLAIARRYAGSDGALDYLAASIRDGGQGRWRRSAWTTRANWRNGCWTWCQTSQHQANRKPINHH